MTSAQSSLAQMPSLPPTLYANIKRIVDLYNDGSDKNSHVAFYKDEILRFCDEAGYSYTQEFHVKWMGIHPANRGGEGVHPGRAQTRVLKIFTAGFSLPAIRDNLVGMEDHPVLRQIEKFTLQSCSLSPEYAVYKKGEIKGGCLGASHATHGFAQVHDERPCHIPAISDGGVMSKAKLFTDKGIETAATKGLKYLMVRWEIGAVFGDVPIIISAALNTVQQIGEGL